ncbi:MAG: FKBP-type peptidyl-prolyl cis-trans isomerase [Bacteroidota bacterium]|nr:FKBP-type peptidyl-prolyl cis-trans isomerase [Bacteroidota bacterium]
MNKSISLVAAALLIFAIGCKQQDFKKDKDGTEYKLISNPNGQKAVEGDIMELNLLVKYKDSLLFNSIEKSAPRFLPYDTAQLPSYFKEVHEGDSLVLRQSTDSLIKYGQGAPFMKKGNYIIQSFKVVKLFHSREAADSAAKTYEAAAKAINKKTVIDKVEKEITSNDSLVKADDKIIKDYMAKNNLTGTKTKWGTYVVIDNPGTGPNLSDSDIAEVNYTGRTFDDSTFDSNTIPKFGHVQPLYVDMNEFRVIPGWIDGLKLMQKGTKGKILIPSYLAWGTTGAPPKIAPNSNVIFDIEVTDVLNQQQYQEVLDKQQKQMEQQRQMMQQIQQMQRQQQQKQQQQAQPQEKK